MNVTDAYKDGTVMSRAVEAIQAQLATNEANKGKEFYRHEYDLALHVYTALDRAGLKVIRKRIH